MQQQQISFLRRIRTARALGAEAGGHCADKAEARDPEFKTRAMEFIGALVRQQGRISGEEATRAAVLAGIRPHDDRAFGPVYAALIKQGLIRVVDSCARVRGHGTAGGRVYGPGDRAA